MKLSCSSWSYHRAFEAKRFDVFSWIEHCAGPLALDGVEIEDKHIPNASASGLGALKRAIGDCGVALANLTTFNDFGHRDAQHNARELDGVKRWVDHAATLGAPSLRVFAGWPKGDRQAAWGPMLDWLGRAAERAGQVGITLVLENHNHGGFIQTSADTLRALEGVSSPWLKPLLDTGNYLDGMVSIERILPLAPHVHAKLLQLDAAGRDAAVDHRRVVALLRQSGYTGFMSVEYEGAEDEAAAVPRGVAYLRGLLREGEP